MNWITRRFKLHPNAQNYIEKTHNYEARLSRLCKIIFYIINIFIAVNVLGGAIITSLVFSKIIWKEFPIWFFFATASVSAISTFWGSILNFFLISKIANDYEIKATKIEEELILYRTRLRHYKNKKNPEVILFDEIFKIRNQGYFIERAQRRLKYEEYKYTPGNTATTRRRDIDKTV